MTTMQDILEERSTTHGQWQRNSEIAEALCDVMFKELPSTLPAPISQAIWHICSKLSRAAAGNPYIEDHYRDIAGYATLAADYLKEHHSDQS